MKDYVRYGVWYMFVYTFVCGKGIDMGVVLRDWIQGSYLACESVWWQSRRTDKHRGWMKEGMIA